MSQHPRDISRRVVFFFFCERTLDLEGVFSGLNSVKREATMASACHFRATTWSSKDFSNTDFAFFLFFFFNRDRKNDNETTRGIIIRIKFDKGSTRIHFFSFLSLSFSPDPTRYHEISFVSCVFDNLQKMTRLASSELQQSSRQDRILPVPRRAEAMKNRKQPARAERCERVTNVPSSPHLPLIQVNIIPKPELTIHYLPIPFTHRPRIYNIRYIFSNSYNFPKLIFFLHENTRRTF